VASSAGEVEALKRTIAEVHERNHHHYHLSRGEDRPMPMDGVLRAGERGTAGVRSMHTE
jgi:hypothetical protein